MRRVIWHLSVIAAALGVVGAALTPVQATGAIRSPSGRSTVARSAKAWRVIYWAKSSSAHIHSIVAPAKRDAWAVGTIRNAGRAERPLVLHWNGAKWARYSVPGLPPNCDPTEVAASSPGNVWIFCFQESGDVIHRWDGRSWHTMAAAPGVGAVDEAVVLSGTNAWMQGTTACDGCTDIEQWNGRTWVSRPVGLNTVWFLAGVGTQLAVIGCDSPAEFCRPSAFRWTGARWQSVAGPYHRRTVDPTIAVSPSGELWIQSFPMRHGHVIVYQRRSGRWRTVVGPNRLSGQPMEYQSTLTYDGHGGVWSGASAHWTGQRWINAILVDWPVSEPAVIEGVAAPVPGTASAWGLGSGAPCPSQRCPRDFIAEFGGLP